jgi:hypothetical protein
MSDHEDLTHDAVQDHVRDLTARQQRLLSAIASLRDEVGKLRDEVGKMHEMLDRWECLADFFEDQGIAELLKERGLEGK